MQFHPTKIYQPILLLVAGCLVLARCGEGQTEDVHREISLVPHEDNSSNEVADVVRRQRQLFATLDARRDIAELTTSRFHVRNDRHAENESDSSYARELRLMRLLDALRTRATLDTSFVIEAGELAAYRDFQAYPLSSNQIIIIAQRQDGPVVLTNWVLQRGGWKAAGIVLNPSDAMLAPMYDRWSRSARQRSR